MWLEKIMRAVRRGINSVKELERVKREEAEQAAAQAPVALLNLLAPDFPPLFPSWAELEVNPDFNLLALF